MIGISTQALTSEISPLTPLSPILTVSFPHYFLQATGHLAEQLKTREWIVARITLITERVVDSKVGLKSIVPATGALGANIGVGVLGGYQ